MAGDPDADLEEVVKGLTLDELQTFTYEEMPLGELCLPSMRWILRRHHLVDDASTVQLYRDYILSAYSVAIQFEALINELHPLAVMVFNGMQFPEAAARWVAQKHGIPAYSMRLGCEPLPLSLLPVRPRPTRLISRIISN